MDAGEDEDLKLQRQSSDLVSEFSANLPLLLWRSQNGTPLRAPRKWAQVSKTEKLVTLLEPFQEWPQLLDPHLQKILPILVDAFLAYLTQHRGQYGSNVAKTSQNTALYPLPRAICRLLYTFCKIRGVKVISRFLNNEPKYLDSMLRAFIEWDTINPADPTEYLSGHVTQSLLWEERYVMLVWLSHLLLAPFDLSSLSSGDIPVPYNNLGKLGAIPEQTPGVAKSLLSLGLHYIAVSGKEREAANALLARLALRGDMQALGLLNSLTNWAFTNLKPIEKSEEPSLYACIGILSFIARLAGSGQLDDLAPLLRSIFDQTIRVTQGTSGVSATIYSSAIARKIVVKILRNVTVMALSLSDRGNNSITDDQLSTILEDAIDHLLVSLADKETPVRFAASKALSIITLRLEPDMGTEVIEAVIGSLGENILFEKDDGTLLTPLEARNFGYQTLKRNLSAVDAQRWQGLMLTLSHLLFRRAPPTEQLPDILQSLVSGLAFEQRSSTGTSVGTGVRDAACFGIWALSRKYTTSELQALQQQTIVQITGTAQIGVLQKLAVELVCSACVDPSGNIRRGASAALQELIGRHPNTIAEGISLVQVVDYHAVALRSRAMTDVAKSTAALDSTYWSPLVEALMYWRGIGSQDVASRRQAANAIGILSVQESFKTIKVVLERLLRKLPRIPRNDVESRHGCFMAISATVNTYTNEFRVTRESRETSEGKEVSSMVTRLWDILGSPSGPTDRDLTLQNSRPELTAEASACLISSLARSITLTQLEPPSETLLDRILRILSLCVSRGDNISIETSSTALSTVFPLLSLSKQKETVQAWISHLRTSSKLPSGRGHILALGAVFKQLEGREDMQEGIIAELLRCSEKDELIEKRVSAVRCLSTSVLPYTAVTSTISHSLLGFLKDYTTDRRGDIGSHIRIEAIKAAEILLNADSKSTLNASTTRNLVACLCRLAAEKLDKVRLQAWLCLQSYWESGPNDFPSMQSQFQHFSHVSSQEYFAQILTLYSIEWLRRPLLKGFSTSAIAGTDGLIRASRSALIQFLNAHEASERHAVLVIMLQDLSAIMEEDLQDDRFVIPIIDLLAFLIDSYAVSCPDGQDAIFKAVFKLVQKAHFRSSNIPRLEAAVKVYAALSKLESVREDTLKKLTSLLLHSFPRVRATAADYLFVITDLDDIKYEDWSAQPKQLKEKMEELRAARAPTVATMATAGISAGGLPPNHTVYVRNLEERIKVEQLKVALEEIFSEFGNVVEIVAKTNLKAKGQAFIVYDSVEAATRAIEEVNGFDLFDKPMVLDYAKTRSDATVLRESGNDELEAHKRRRLAEKERKQAHDALEAQKKLKRPAAPADTARPAKTTKGAGLKPTSGTTAAVVPDEYLPPNKILFLRDLPDDATQEGLSAVFSRFEGFQEVRLVPGRKGIAFVEYESESGAISAKEATSGMAMGEQNKPIRVTYQRQ
ncbi:hypothetical protein N7462_004656 [Penicillium macrosclerotiorum]|uniref:uncharacterized protein n=1 Tax=Penicillium macrosclerotiorum TaxID=303699 RepID=UPI002549A475|nr:uncharacterized protein N7462_004656 [Penicillium macrosclerotiorum]KAJ5690264.1 hypothetical protein N7462_004656 [Penicillium macrosclerotiorum]